MSELREALILSAVIVNVANLRRVADISFGL
jgi:hypothetical protein